MSVRPTPLTAGLAGIFSGLTWPLVWPLFNRPDSASTVWLVLATLVLIGVPAHAFVLGFDRSRNAAPGTVDTALLARVGAWLAGAAITALLVAALRASA